MHGLKKFIFQVLALLILIGGAFYVYFSNGQGFNIASTNQSETRKQAQVGNAIFNVTIADTDAKRIKGLGGTSPLATDEGMLFVYDKQGRYAFWMKGLAYPLDFVWIAADKVVDLITNVPPPMPGQKDETLPIYKPVVPVDKVLELNGGTVTRTQIKVGDSVRMID